MDIRTPPHPCPKSHTQILNDHPIPPSPRQVALVQFLEGNDGFREAPMNLDDQGHMAKKVGGQLLFMHIYVT